MKRALRTRAVHAGRQDFADLGVHAPPLDLSTTYPISDLDVAARSLGAMAGGAPPAGNPVYARLYNPTAARFEAALADLEGAQAAVSFGSGMAALTACLLALTSRGFKHIVAVRPIYGGSDHLLSHGLLGLDVDFVAATEVKAALRPDTGLVMIETPANPTLDVIDIAGLARQIGAVPLLVDSTFATPILQRPLEHGATFVLHSATKFLGGHGDVIAGVVATSDDWAATIRQVRIATGALLHPLAAYLLHRGLQTLPIRVEAAQRTAKTLVERLGQHPEVCRVFYPGVDGAEPWLKQQMDGPGAILAFEVHGGQARARALLSELKLLTPAVSLGSTDTLIQHPASLTHQVVDEAARAQSGITEGLIRMSVGLEHADDLWADLAHALEASSPRRWQPAMAG